MPSIRPVASSNRKVYIARTRGQRRSASAADLVSTGGTAVTVVDNPNLADEIVNVQVGGRSLDRASAKTLVKATAKAQKRAEQGKRDKGVLDQVVVDLARPAPTKRTQVDDGYILSYPIAAVLGAIGLFIFFLLSDLDFGAKVLGMFFLAPIGGTIGGIFTLWFWRTLWRMV